MQAFAFNIRRDKFKDPRVRLAFNYAFDFEEMNRQIFFGQYKRIASYFEGTELASTGLPTGRELEILQAVRDQVPPEVFTKPYTNPVGGNPDAVRNNLRQAVQLLHDAGYEIRNGRLVNTKTNEPYAVEFLADDPNFERVFLFYKPALDRLGITVTVRERSTTCSSKTGCATSISTSSPTPGGNRCHPATSNAAIGVRKRPISPARST